MGLVRKALVIGGILFALPTPPASLPVPRADRAPQSATFATFSAAAETFSDFKAFCERRPQACVTGQYLVATLEGKARYSAHLLYEWANPAVQTAPVKLVPKPGQPSLRLATLTDTKPTKIEDQLRDSKE